jgi:hypothetical protein
VIEPAHLWVPPRVGSYGDEAIDLAKEAGRSLDEEQRHGVDALLSYGPAGRWVALEAAFIEARQNGKTAGVLLPVTLFDLFLLPPDRIVWTAHLFRTSREAFDDFCKCIESSAMLSRRVKKISYSHGEESIELHSGAQLDFLARSSGGGRGLGGKRVVMDEALFLGAGAMGALMPVLSAREDPQVNYGSSAGKTTSEYLARLVKRGRAGGDPSLIWVEYCAPGGWEDPPCELGKKCPHFVGTRGCALDDPANWRQANHTLGKRISVEYVEAERRALPPLEFGRERNGWHEVVATETAPMSEKDWGDLTDVESEMVDPVALGIEVANDRSTAAIGVVGRRADGKYHLEIIKSAPGVAWVVGDAVKLNKRWKPCVIVLDDKSEAASLLPEFKEAGLKVRDRDPDKAAKSEDIIVTTWANDLARASGLLYSAVTETRNLRHLNQSDLNDSVKGAAWRQLGDAKAWSRKDATTNPCPLLAVTLGLYGLVIYGPKQPGQQFFGSWR